MDEREAAQRLFHLFNVFRQEHAPKGKKKTGMDQRDMMMLKAIMKLNQGDTVKMSQLSDYFHITPAAISQGIRNFENKGWVERVILEEDRRSVYVKVTDKAKKLILNCEHHDTEKVVDFLRYLGEEDYLALIRIMEKAIKYMK